MYNYFQLYRSNNGSNQIGGGKKMPFSYLGELANSDNNTLYSNRINPIKYRDQWINNCNKPSYVYFGTPNPLLHEMKPMKVPKDSMFYFSNAKFSPECCLGGAPYTTSSGCVCTFPKQIYKCNNQKLYDEPIPGPNSWQ